MTPGAALRDAGRGLFVSVMVFSALVNLLMLTGPVFMLQVYDRVLSSQSQATLIALSGLTAFLYAVMVVLDHARARLVARIGARLSRRLERPVFLAVQRLQARRPGDPLARQATQDLDTLQRWLASPVFLAMFDAPWTPVFVALIWAFHPALGILALLGGGGLLFLAVLNQMLVRNRMAAAAEAAQAADRLGSALRAEAATLTALGMTGPALGRWQGLRAGALSASMAGSDRAGFFAAATRGVRLFLQSAMLAVGAWLVLAGELGPGAMIAASIILGRALAPVEVAVGQWGSVQAARLGWLRLGQVLATLPVEGPRLSLPRPRGDLNVEEVIVVPPGEVRAVLRDISFQLPAGRTLGVLGPSGAGKSTLARALVGAWPPLSGAVRLDGLALDAFDSDRLGTLLGYLPQRVTLFDGTIAENIARLNPGAGADTILAAAQAAGAHAMILGLPRGYDTRVGDEGGGLSGGQLQRIGLARALFGDPVLVVLDEPDAHLDAAGLAELAATLRGLRARGATVVIVAHRPSALATCDDLLVLEDGRIADFGPRSDVLRAQTRLGGPSVGNRHQGHAGRIGRLAMAGSGGGPGFSGPDSHRAGSMTQGQGSAPVAEPAETPVDHAAKVPAG
jgi:ATP-binding cassette, subfamily C, bacterial